MHFKPLVNILFVTSLLFLFPKKVISQWYSLNSGTSKSLQCISFPSVNIGYVLPMNGFILRTLNGGIKWDTLSSLKLSSSFSFTNNINFVDDSFGCISTNDNMGVKLFLTTDMGNTFKDITPANNLKGIIRIKFLNRKTGYVFSNSAFDDQFWRTNDSGKTWKKIVLGFSLGSGTSSLPTMAFINDSTGYLAGGDGSFNYKGIIKRTTDYGKNWSTYTLMNNSNINAMHFPNPDTGYVISHEGIIFGTKNNGSTWDSLSRVNLVNNSSEIFFVNGRTGYIISGNKIYKSLDGGKIWKLQNSPGQQAYRGLFFTDAYTGYVVGDSGTIIKTSNGGELTRIKYISNDGLQINIFPIPSTGLVNINVLSEGNKNTPFRIRVFDINGKIVIDRQIYGSNHFCVDLENGLYFYTFENSSNLLKSGKLLVY